MRKAILNKINTINGMLKEVNNLSNFVHTYDGGTFPYYIILKSPIEIKNQFVYIHEEKAKHSYNFEKRYNTNNETQSEDLNYHLNLICKEFKKAIKNQ